MTRVFDIFLSLTGLLLGFPILISLWILGWVESGSPLFKQERVGKNQRPFILIKFRTMRVDTPSSPTHLISGSAVTRLGRLLRRTKLDELPQLWNVLKGEMSLVGPRPCLYSQLELIAERAARDVFSSRPGITGIAQLTGVDMSTPRLLAEIDAQMLCNFSLRTYFLCIIKTVSGAGQGDRTR